MNEMKIIKTIVLAALCVFAVSCGGPDIEKGLVLYSGFEGDAGDGGPNHYDGMLRSGAVISDDSAVGESSVYFDGKEAFVEYPADKVYFDGDYSISIWVKWEECHLWDRILDFNQVMPQAGNAVTWRIGYPEKGKENSLWLDQWVLDNDLNPVASVIDIHNSPADAYLDYNVKLGQWDHYVVVYDSKAKNPHGIQHNEKGQEIRYRGVVTLYVNGKKVGTNNHCFNPQPIPTVANWLGRSRYQGDPHFKGWMDDFRIYDRTLSAQEVKDLYDLSED